MKCAVLKYLQPLLPSQSYIIKEYAPKLCMYETINFKKCFSELLSLLMIVIVIIYCHRNWRHILLCMMTDLYSSIDSGRIWLGCYITCPLGPLFLILEILPAELLYCVLRTMNFQEVHFERKEKALGSNTCKTI